MSDRRCGDFARGIGIAAIIIGSFGLMVGWMPFIGVVGMPLAMLAIIVGLIGVISGIPSKSTGLPFAGMIIGIIAIVIQFYSFSMISSTYNEYMERANASVNETRLQSELSDAEIAARSIDVIESEYLKRDDMHLVRIGISNISNRPLDSAKVEVRFVSQFGTTYATGNLEILTPETVDVLMPGQPFRLTSGNYFVFDDVDASLPIDSVQATPLSVSFQ